MSSQVAVLTYPTSVWGPRWGWPCWNCVDIFGTRKLQILGYRAALFAWSYICLAVLVQCQLVTDEQTDRRTDTLLRVEVD